MRKEIGEDLKELKAVLRLLADVLASEELDEDELFDLNDDSFEDDYYNYHDDHDDKHVVEVYCDENGEIYYDLDDELLEIIDLQALEEIISHIVSEEDIDDNGKVIDLEEYRRKKNNAVAETLFDDECCCCCCCCCRRCCDTDFLN